MSTRVVSKPSPASSSSSYAVSAPTPITLATHAEPPASIKFWAAQNVDHFKGEGYKVQICT
ncbi:hypothetical protein DSO57_1015560 [Entomophthora muscae]|uniref:Uncharacterized protein n=1 Tax=Entomophthora muscae TaxID=34485 RepID=A0ACC2RW78_9FUNG|nr:hypothetical protein DSO57_1015560 [Entomophthora muscae]